MGAGIPSSPCSKEPCKAEEPHGWGCAPEKPPWPSEQISLQCSAFSVLSPCPRAGCVPSWVPCPCPWGSVVAIALLGVLGPPSLPSGPTCLSSCPAGSSAATPAPAAPFGNRWNYPPGKSLTGSSRWLEEGSSSLGALPTALNLLSHGRGSTRDHLSLLHCRGVPPGIGAPQALAAHPTPRQSWGSLGSPHAEHPLAAQPRHRESSGTTTR